MSGWVRSMVAMGLAAGLAVCAASVARAEDRYLAVCDASAAAYLGNGHFAVADDESDVLQVYRRGGGGPVGELRLSRYLNPGDRRPNARPVEIDIEGAAAIGDRIYWISSHGRKKDGSVDPQRWRLFATDVDRRAPTPSLMPAGGKAYKSLLVDIATDSRLAFLKEAAELKPEAKGGFNIEGLAATPDGGLLVGFRNPQVTGAAVVLPITNPAAMVDKGAKPQFGDPILLDLGGRGVRSIERVGDQYLIAAGPYGDADTSRAMPVFVLYRWSGRADQAPEMVRSLDFGSFRAEAMFFDADAKDLYLLSDDGAEQVNGRDCKDRKTGEQDKSFRGRPMGVPK
jgi:hypothetical protein